MSDHQIILSDEKLGEVISSIECSLECSQEVLVEVKDEGTLDEIIEQEDHVEILRQLLLRLRSATKQEESTGPG